MDSTLTYVIESMRILPPRGKSKLVVALEAYLDESGIDGRPHCIMAGFVASSRTWVKVMRQWESVRQDFGAPVFHGKRFFRPEAFKHEYPGWSETKRNDYAVALTRIVRRHRLVKIDQAVEASTFMELPEANRRWITGGKRSPVTFKWELSGAKSKPYFFCFILCMHRIVNATNANLISNFYMDEQNTYEGHARNLFARYKQLHPDNRLGSLTYGNRTQFPALQVADLLAYLWNAQLNREPSPFEIQVMWMLLNERHESIDVWRKDTFAEFRAGVIERKSLKGDWSEEDFKRAQRYLESLENNENQN